MSVSEVLIRNAYQIAPLKECPGHGPCQGLIWPDAKDYDELAEGSEHAAGG